MLTTPDHMIGLPTLDLSPSVPWPSLRATAEERNGAAPQVALLPSSGVAPATERPPRVYPPRYPQPPGDPPPSKLPAPAVPNQPKRTFAPPGIVQKNQMQAAASLPPAHPAPGWAPGPPAYAQQAGIIAPPLRTTSAPTPASGPANAAFGMALIGAALFMALYLALYQTSQSLSSLLFAIVFSDIVNLAAIVCGFVALRVVSRSPGQTNRAVAGIVMPCIIILIQIIAFSKGTPS